MLYSSLANLIGEKAMRAAMGEVWEEVEEAMGGRRREEEVKTHARASLKITTIY